MRDRRTPAMIAYAEAASSVRTEELKRLSCLVDCYTIDSADAKDDKVREEFAARRDFFLALTRAAEAISLGRL